MNSLAGRNILITGASSGLGAEMARYCASLGAAVAVGARRTDKLETLAAEIQRSGGVAQAYALDVQDESSVESAFEAAGKDFGGIDCAIANAGISVPGDALHQDIEIFDRTVSINLRGAFLTARAAARQITLHGKRDGRIVLVASIAASVPLKHLSAYCATKAGVVMLARSLAQDWIDIPINVNAICPGYALTEMNADWFMSEAGKRQQARFPRQRLVSTEAVAAMGAHLLSPEARHITGSVFTVDDGQSFRL